MSNVDLDRLDALFAALPQGEWRYGVSKSGRPQIYSRKPDGSTVQVAMVWGTVANPAGQVGPAICAMRDMLRAAAAELRTLRARVAELPAGAVELTDGTNEYNDLIAERDRLRAERDAARDEAAGLREALVKINRAVSRLDGCATPELRELGLNLRLVCRDAMLSTPAQHRGRIVAAGLREAAEKLVSTHQHQGLWHSDGTRDAKDVLMSEADRLERGE